MVGACQGRHQVLCASVMGTTEHLWLFQASVRDVCQRGVMAETEMKVMVTVARAGRFEMEFAGSLFKSMLIDPHVGR